MKKCKGILSIVLCFVILCGFLTLTGYSSAPRTGVTTDAVNVRSAPDTSDSGNIIYNNLPKGVILTIIDEVSGNTSKPWYKVEFDHNGVHYSDCYVSSGYVSIVPAETPDSKSGVISSKANVRSGPGTNYSLVYEDLPQGVMVTIVGEFSSSTTSKPWYKVEFNYGGRFYSDCYISSGLVSVIEDNISSDVPAEYQSYITALKAKHPNWNFEFLYTGLDWNAVMNGENVLGRSLVSGRSNPTSYFSKAEGAYDSSTGKYIPQDGTSWYQAHPDVVAYYMDPRNFLTDDKYIFQFELLSYNSSLQDLAGVNKILNNSFMSNAYISTGEQSGSADLTGEGNVDIADAMRLFQFVSGKISTLGDYYSRADFTGDGNVDIADAMKLFQFVSGKIDSIGSTSITYAEAFMKAGEISSVSPYHLAARVIQEVSRNGSGSTSGNYGNYPGIYNFYNIGASAGSDPISNGLKWASTSSEDEKYLRPWNSRYKSIVGGAIYIEKGYIGSGQDTLYLQKFDVESNYHGTYWHQYMGNIQAPASESSTVYKNYSNMSMLGYSFTFVIPYYNNMPSTPCKLPA